MIADPPTAPAEARIRRFVSRARVRAEETGGLHSVIEHTLPAGTVAMPPHRHPRVGLLTSTLPHNTHRSLDRRLLSSVEASSPHCCPLACHCYRPPLSPLLLILQPLDPAAAGCHCN